MFTLWNETSSHITSLDKTLTMVSLLHELVHNEVEHGFIAQRGQLESNETN